jgi:soluble lytic murein transglycosylase-like protein
VVNQDAAAQYADIVTAASQATGVPVGLANGLIQVESAWDPNALRSEPQIGDASRGLTQILYRTAVGLGFLGSAEDLFDPYLNIPLGLKELAAEYARAGTWAGALSAYNGGWNPSKGFGAVLTAPRVVVLAHDPVTGAASVTRTAQAGEYANQPYVDRVLAAAAEYGWTEGAGVQTSAIGGLVGLGLAGAALAGLARARGWI